jgi:hypothetical protein
VERCSHAVLLVQVGVAAQLRVYEVAKVAGARACIRHPVLEYRPEVGIASGKIYLVLERSVDGRHPLANHPIRRTLEWSDTKHK